MEIEYYTKIKILEQIQCLSSLIKIHFINTEKIGIFAIRINLKQFQLTNLKIITKVFTARYLENLLGDVQQRL